MAGAYDIATAAVGGGLNTIGTLITNYQQHKYDLESMEKSHKYNEESAENAFARQKQFYEQYQTPSAQIKQMQQAGLSPSMYAGGGMSGGQGTSVPQGGGTSPVSSSMNKYEIDPLTAAQIEDLKASAAEKRANAGEKQGDNPMGQAIIKNYNASTQNLIASAETEIEKKRLTHAQAETQEFINWLNDATSANQLQLSNQELNAAYYNNLILFEQWQQQQIKTDIDKETKQTKINQAKADFQETWSRINLNKAIKELNEKQAEMLKNEIDKFITNHTYKTLELGDEELFGYFDNEWIAEIKTELYKFEKANNTEISGQNKQAIAKLVGSLIMMALMAAK